MFLRWFLHQNPAKICKKGERAEFDQHLECIAPKRLSKYTTPNLSYIAVNVTFNSPSYYLSFFLSFSLLSDFLCLPQSLLFCSQYSLPHTHNINGCWPILNRKRKNVLCLPANKFPKCGKILFLLDTFPYIDIVGN